jgi:hypothetical protein
MLKPQGLFLISQIGLNYVNYLCTVLFIFTIHFSFYSELQTVERKIKVFLIYSIILMRCLIINYKYICTILTRIATVRLRLNCFFHARCQLKNVYNVSDTVLVRIFSTNSKTNLGVTSNIYLYCPRTKMKRRGEERVGGRGVNSERGGGKAMRRRRRRRLPRRSSQLTAAVDEHDVPIFFAFLSCATVYFLNRNNSIKKIVKTLGPRAVNKYIYGKYERELL